MTFDQLPDPFEDRGAQDVDGIELKCHFCGGDTDAERLCYGCGVYLCEACEDIEDDPWDDHKPGDHPAASPAANRIVVQQQDPDFLYD